MEIDELKKIIVRHLLGQATDDEIRLLDQWQGQSGSNRKLLEQLASESFLKKAIGDKQVELRAREWQKLEWLTTGKRRRIVRMRWLKVAAAVLIPLAGGVTAWEMMVDHDNRNLPGMVEQIQTGSSKAVVELAGGEQIVLSNDTTFMLANQGVQLVNRRDTLNLISSHTTVDLKNSFHVIRIPRGGEYIARLDDGSVVHLNSGSEMKVPVDFGVKERNVWLKGEAFFDVTRDENRVFTVHTEKADISVLGTEFDVRAYEDEPEMLTTLVTGAVEVSSGTVVDRLKPGYQARVGAKGEIEIGKVEVYPFIAWKTGRMVFENERLEKIMTELQRWYDFEIFYANPEVKEMRFTIDILKYEDISKVLSLMEKMEKVTFSRQGRSVVLRQR